MITLDQINNSICQIQEALDVPQSGEWDNETKAALKNFQLRLKLVPTGIADVKTITLLLERSNIQMTDSSIEDLDATTDLSENKLTITTKLLPITEYVKDSIQQYQYIFLHHTSGWNNPIAVVDDWASDQRGRIGTQYIIGGKSIKGSSEHDGNIIKCIPDGSWAYHLGSTSKDGINMHMHKNSIGIELCNFGYLTKSGNDYITYSNSKVDPTQVIDLGYEFRGYRYWHSYSSKQLNSLKFLLIKLSKDFKIDLNLGLKSWLLNHNANHKAFEYSKDATAGLIKGVLSHTNVRKDKTDVYPHPELIKLILSL